MSDTLHLNPTLPTYFRLIAASGLLLLGACAAQASAEGGRGEDFVLDRNYNGPRAQIAVSRFDEGREGGSRWRLDSGDGRVLEGSFEHTSGGSVIQNISDMLANALFQTNRFTVLEREHLDEVQREQSIQDEGWVESEDQARGNVMRADLLVYGSITEWEPAAAKSQAAGGAGVLDVVGAFIGGLVGGNDKARVGLSIRVIDSSNTQLVFSGHYVGEGTGSNQSWGGAMILGGIGLGGGMSNEEAAPMNEALRMALAQAVTDMGRELVDSGKYPRKPPAES